MKVKGEVEVKRREVYSHTGSTWMDLLWGTVPALQPKKNRNHSGVRCWTSSCSFPLSAKLSFPESAKAKFILCHWVEMIPVAEVGLISAGWSHMAHPYQSFILINCIYLAVSLPPSSPTYSPHLLQLKWTQRMQTTLTLNKKTNLLQYRWS